MGEFIKTLKLQWWDMVEPPWRHASPTEGRVEHWITWLVGWAWVLAGLVLGALVAPQLVQWVALSDTQYEDWLTIGMAVFAGFLVQFMGWSLVAAFAALTQRLPDDIIVPSWVPEWLVPLLDALVHGLVYGVMGIVSSLPLSAVGYGIYRYLTSVGAGQGTITVAFVGALLIKTFAIPLIKGLVTGALFKWFMRWLRGGNKAKPA